MADFTFQLSAVVRRHKLIGQCADGVVQFSLLARLIDGLSALGDVLCPDPPGKQSRTFYLLTRIKFDIFPPQRRALRAYAFQPELSRCHVLIFCTDHFRPAGGLESRAMQVTVAFRSERTCSSSPLRRGDPLNCRL